MSKTTSGGRGLKNLVSASSMAVLAGEQTRLVEIALDDIVPNPHQPRQHFDEEGLNELAASIREMGVLQPVLVQPAGADGKYQLVAGERRWRASRRAGKTTIPALVKRTDEVASMEQALVENIQRRDLNAYEEALAYQQLIEDFQLTHEQLGQRLGKSRATITNMLRILQLPASVQTLINDGSLLISHAKVLLKTPDRSLQEQLAKAAASDGWSVKMLDDAVSGRSDEPEPDDEPAEAPATKGSTGGSSSSTPSPSLRPAGLLELEELLETLLSTRVNISMGTNKGKVVIEFADLEDLERIYHQMTTRSGDTAS
jgi:ParB family chromosome partitioning protein